MYVIDTVREIMDQEMCIIHVDVPLEVAAFEDVTGNTDGNENNEIVCEVWEESFREETGVINETLAKIVNMREADSGVFLVETGGIANDVPLSVSADETLNNPGTENILVVCSGNDLLNNNLSPEGDHSYVCRRTVPEARDDVTLNLNASVPVVQNESDTPNRSRKRKANRDEWERNKNKKLRQEGKPYGNNEGRCLGKRCEKESCKKSKKRFCDQLTEHSRKEVFHHFWSNMAWEERKTYVVSLVDSVKPVQKRRTDSGDRRGATLHYHLRIGSERKEVCKQMFLNTLDIKEWSVRNWAQGGKHGMRRAEEKHVERSRTRGALSSSSQIPLAPSENAALFIDRLPKVESHYCRKSTSKVYLEPLFQSLQQLYRVYVEECKSEEKDFVSRFTFSNIISDKNVALFKPKKDQCDTCVQHKVGQLSDEDWGNHIRNKEKARTEKQKDKDEALAGNCIVLAADLQAVKLAPCLKASALYYKTKLCVHNYTIYNLKTHSVVCYWWNESEGELKASNFTSCLLDFLRELMSNWPEESPKVIIIWTDGCGYQNRNKILSNALLNIAAEENFTIHQKYLLKGHTQMEVDSVHSVIERKLVNRDIYLPSDYLSATKEARQKPFPYHVKSISHEFFKNYDVPLIYNYSSIRPGNKVSDPTVNDVVHYMYSPNGKISYRLNFDDELQLLPRRSKGPEGHRSNQCLPMYRDRLKINQPKWQHLQQLKSVIPLEAHSFYDTLPH